MAKRKTCPHPCELGFHKPYKIASENVKNNHEDKKSTCIVFPKQILHGKWPINKVETLEFDLRVFQKKTQIITFVQKPRKIVFVLRVKIENI